MHSRFGKWAILLSTFLTTWFIFGFSFTFGAVYLAMLDKFNEGRPKTATVQSLLIGIASCFGVVVGFIVSRVGLTIPLLVGATLAPLGLILSFFAESILALDICIGVVTALGTSFTYYTSVVATGKAFTGPKRALALSIQNSAISFAGVTYPYILEWLLSTFSFSGTVLIIGGLFLNASPAALIIAKLDKHIDDRPNCCKKTGKIRATPLDLTAEHRPLLQRSDSSNGIVSPHYDKDQETGRSQATDMQDSDDKMQNVQAGLFSLPYLCLVIGETFSVALLNGYNTVVLDIFKWKGYSEERGLLSFIPLQLSALVARLLPGVVAQNTGVNVLHLLIMYACCGTLGQLVILFSESYTVILVGVGLTGICLGGCVCAGIVALGGIIGQKNFPIALGLLNTSIGVLTIACGPLFGTIRDMTNSYMMVLVLITSMLMLGGAFFLICNCLRQRRLKTSLSQYQRIST